MKEFIRITELKKSDWSQIDNLQFTTVKKEEKVGEEVKTKINENQNKKLNELESEIVELWGRGMKWNEVN